MGVILCREGRFETGEGYEGMIKKLLDELDLGDNVKFLDFVLDKEIQDLYKKAKIFYLPSKMETFGRVYAEAMASGTPIVAMKNSAVQYVVTEGMTGFLGNKEEVQKEAILKLLTDDEFYKKMQENCLKEAEKVRWESVIRGWKEVIEELTLDSEKKMNYMNFLNLIFLQREN